MDQLVLYFGMALTALAGATILPSLKCHIFSINRLLPGTP